MDIGEIKQRADRELELMQGCLPAVGNLPVEKEALIKELCDIARSLHSTANRLAGYAGYLKRGKNE